MNNQYDDDFNVLDKAVKNKEYVVIQAANGMTYTGRAQNLTHPSGDKAWARITVVYEKDGVETPTDIFLGQICSIQTTTKEKIEDVRSKKRP